MAELRHHSLVAWQRADDLFIKLHVLTIKQFPAFEFESELNGVGAPLVGLICSTRLMKGTIPLLVLVCGLLIGLFVG